MIEIGFGMGDVSGRVSVRSSGSMMLIVVPVMRGRCGFVVEVWSVVKTAG
jgi:hypothetical protein